MSKGEREPKIGVVEVKMTALNLSVCHAIRGGVHPPPCDARGGATCSPHL